MPETLPATPEIPVENLNPTSFLESLKGMGFEDALSSIANGVVHFAFKLLIAILVFYIGRFLIKKIYKVIFNMMTSRKVDASLTTFTLSLVKMTLYFILIITVIGILGIETSSFIAIFASAGVAIGMALSGTLQNFAGGVLILLLKPYKVGDFIEVQGYNGTVKSIQLFNTVINTIDNKAIIVPNGVLSTSSINNYSLENYRRVDWDVALSYGTDFEAAKKAILDILLSDERVIKENTEEGDNDCGENQIKVNGDCVDLIEEKTQKKGFFHRVFHKKRMEIANTIADNSMELPVALPVKSDRSPFVGLKEMADSSIVLAVRAWTASSNYWPLYFAMNERFYTELQQQGFSFPFPQLDVHLNPQQ